MGFIDLDIGKWGDEAATWAKKNPAYAIGGAAGAAVIGYLWWKNHQAAQAPASSTGQDTSGDSSDPFGLNDLTGDSSGGSSGGTSTSTTPGVCPQVIMACQPGQTPVYGTDANGCTTVTCSGTPTNPPTSPPTNPPTNPPTGGQSYTVKSGDTLSSIANRYHTTWQYIYNEDKSIIDATAQAHGHYSQEYNWIFPGEVLTI